MFVIQVKGISCGHCVNAITQALTELDSKAKVQIDKATQTVRFDGNATQTNQNHLKSFLFVINE